MSVRRFEQEVVRVMADEPVVEVARRMRDSRVGCVVIVRDGKPLGILTDRDLALRVLAEGRDPRGLVARDVMTYDPVTLAHALGIESASRLMREHGVRRIPLVDDAGVLVGIVTADDLMSLFARELADTAESLLGGVDSVESR